MTVELRRKRIDKTRSEAWPGGCSSLAVVTHPAYDLAGVSAKHDFSDWSNTALSWSLRIQVAKSFT
jgi:hypothetical protein